MSTAAELRRLAFMDWLRVNSLNLYKVAKASGVPYTTLDSYKRGDTISLKGTTEQQIARAYDLPLEAIFGSSDDDGGIVEPNNVRAWREHAGLSLKHVADEVGTTVTVLELLEDGRITLSPKWLHRLSPVLRARAGWILEYRPDQLPRDVLEIFAQIPEERHDQALAILETFRRTGTSN